MVAAAQVAQHNGRKSQPTGSVRHTDYGLKRAAVAIGCFCHIVPGIFGCFSTTQYGETSWQGVRGCLRMSEGAEGEGQSRVRASRG